MHAKPRGSVAKDPQCTSARIAALSRHRGPTRQGIAAGGWHRQTLCRFGPRPQASDLPTGNPFPLRAAGRCTVKRELPKTHRPFSGKVHEDRVRRIRPRRRPKTYRSAVHVIEEIDGAAESPLTEVVIEHAAGARKLGPAVHH